MRLMTIVIGMYMASLDVTPIAMGYGGFCSGFKDGFKAGACYGKGVTCLAPIAPVCPLPSPGQNSYQDGYNRGFVIGRGR